MLLLDEPLGALDLKLRENMQEELKALQKTLGITFIFVTHDQGEALSMADRVAVFSDGKIMQIGSPEEIYRQPNSRFVADFVGSSNILPPDFVAGIGGERRWASLRPEAISVGPVGAGTLSGTVTARSYLGASTRLAINANGALLHALVPSADELPLEGQAVSLSFPKDALHLMEREG